jgi:hypothetical protein
LPLQIVSRKAAFENSPQQFMHIRRFRFCFALEPASLSA